MRTFKVCWVAHLPKERANILPSLLQHVHFPLMSMDEVSCIFFMQKNDEKFCIYNL
jgi:hypothetical protein